VFVTDELWCKLCSQLAIFTQVLQSDNDTDDLKVSAKDISATSSLMAENRHNPFCV